MATENNTVRDIGAAAEALARLEGESLLVASETMAGGRAVTRETLKTAASQGRDALLVAASRPAEPALLDAGVEVLDCTPGSTSGAGVHNVGSPGDLTGLSMPLSEFLAEADGPVVAVDSLTTLLQYNDRSTAFRFLTVLSAQVGRSQGGALCVVSPTCHDEQTVHTFEQLFDSRALVTGRRVRLGDAADSESPMTQ